MPQYAVRTSFTFTGTFFISAQNKEEAKEFVNKHCGLVIGGNIHSTLPHKNTDWDFPIHPEKTVGRVKLNNGEEQRYG